MSKEGFLVLHEEGRRSQIYYCVLGEGKLQFYSRREAGVLLKDVSLTKSKLKIRGVPDHEARHCPFSFSVVVHHSKIVDGRQIVHGKPTTLLMSAPSWAERRAWGNTIHCWQRNYWGEPEHRLSMLSDAEIEAFFQEQHRSLEEMLLTATGKATSSSSSSSATTPRNAGSSSTSNRAGRSIFSRAPSIRKMGGAVRKKIHSASVTISLPPMNLSITSSLQQLRPQQQQQQPAAATAH